MFLVNEIEKLLAELEAEKLKVKTVIRYVKDRR